MEIGISLTIVFVVLKLVGVIDWSWWWVFSPLWISAIITGIMFGVFGVAHVFFSRRERRRVAHVEDTLEGTQEVIEHPPWKKPKRSKKRIAFCIIGAILIYVDTTYDIPVAVLLPRLYLLGLFFAIFGSYIWAKEKGRSGWWCLMGLIAPFGYIVLMKLKDKRVLKEAPPPAQQQTTPIVLPTPMEQQPTMKFCPECGFKITEQMAYCPNCGRELKRTRS